MEHLTHAWFCAIGQLRVLHVIKKVFFKLYEIKIIVISASIRPTALNLDPGELPTALQMPGLVMQLGSLNESASRPGIKKITSEAEIPAAPKQLEPISCAPAGGNLTVSAPRVESLAFFGRKAKANTLTVRNAICDFHILVGTSLTDDPLTQSADLLLFHLSDVSNDHLRHASETMRAVEDRGVNRQLIRRGSADVVPALLPGNYRVSALGLDGMPKADIPAEFSAGALRFKVDTARDGGTTAYRITRKK